MEWPIVEIFGLIIKLMQVIDSQGTARKGANKGMALDEVTEMPKPKTMKAKDVARKIKSFDHFIHVWGDKAKYYLPPKRCLTWHYISQILCKEKRLLKLEQVGHEVEIPKVKGEVLQNMWEKTKDVNSMYLYFPDIHKSINIPRQYFFNVKLIRS